MNQEKYEEVERHLFKLKGKHKKDAYVNHQIKCYELLSDAINGKRVYAHMDELDEEGEFIQFSIVTDAMLKYDSIMAEIDGYRPYFFSFIASYDKKFISIIKEQYNKNDEGKNTWFLATFMEEVPIDRVLYQLEGNIEFAASPCIYLKGKITIVDEEIDENIIKSINDTTYAITVNTDTEVQSNLETVLGGVTFDHAYIYKIGHGNLVRICGKDQIDDNCITQDFSILFDVGTHWGRPTWKVNHYKNAILAIKRNTPDVVILSHWDADHFMGVVHSKGDIFERKWFVPEITNGNANAMRVVAYLHCKGNLTVVKRELTEGIVALIPIRTSMTPTSSIQGYLALCRGQNRVLDVTNMSKENCGGLSLVYRFGDIKSVFCGDSPYMAGERILWSGSKIYDYLIVPHHARRMTVNPYLTYNINGGYAIYCRDKTGNPDHIDDLKNENYKDVLTEKAKTRCYRIDLTKHRKPSSI